MSNFTPLKINKSVNKNKNIFLLVGNLFLLILVVILGVFIFTGQKLMPTEQKATGVKCSTITNRKDCISSCSPPKGNNKNGYQCKWINNKCVESSRECGMLGTGIGCFGNNGTIKEYTGYLKTQGNNCVSPEKTPTRVSYFFCKNPQNPSAGCPNNIDKADEEILLTADSNQQVCFKYSCGAEQIDFQFNDATCYFSRSGPVCGNFNQQSPPTDTPIPPTNTPIPPTNTPVPPTNTPILPTNTPILPTNTLTPTIESSATPTPTETPTIVVTNTPGPSPTATNTPTPTEIIIAQVTSTPTSEQPTNTPPPPVTADQRPAFIYLVPLLLISLGLLL